MTRGLLQQRVHQYSIYIFTFLFPVIADGFCLFFCSYAKRQVDQRIAVRPYLTAYCVFLIGGGDPGETLSPEQYQAIVDAVFDTNGKKVGGICLVKGRTPVQSGFEGQWYTL